jgi:hypothetical protein
MRRWSGGIRRGRWWWNFRFLLPLAGEGGLRRRSDEGSRRLIVEADGPQHEDNGAHDVARDAWLREQGFQVLRFPNELIATNADAVLNTIRKAVGIAG